MAAVTDVERAIQVVQASPYSRPPVTGGGVSLASLYSRENSQQDRTLSLNEKLAMLDQSQISFKVGRVPSASNINSSAKRAQSPAKLAKKAVD